MNPVVGITIGDANGIGPEVILKTLENPSMLHYCTPVVYGSSKVLEYYKNLYNLTGPDWNDVPDIQHIIKNKVNVINCLKPEPNVLPGVSTSQTGKAAWQALQTCVEHAKAKCIDAVVTGPIDKKSIVAGGFKWIGHTEYLKEVFTAEEVLMLMVSDDLRLTLVTEHLPIREIANKITLEKIIAKIKLCVKVLQSDFAIQKPKVAVLGLNPHAGDNGLLGSEESEIIKKAIEHMKELGHIVYGPFSADGFFAAQTYRSFDLVLAMYHDQGLIPFKMVSFASGVHVTAGLPIIRTSPDHGTAFDIAGKNIANENSFRQAIFCALELIKNREMAQPFVES